VFALTYAAGHDFGLDERLLLSTLAQQAATAVHNARLYQEIEAGYLSTVQAMVQVTDARERYAAGHAERVRAYCAAAAAALGLGAAPTATLELAALFHDLGHVGIPEAVLGKPGALTAEEWALVRRHPQLGVSILRQVPRMEAVVPVILQHHERYDGQGYPAGLLGDDTGVLAQVLAVADAYEAMTSARPHRAALGRAEAVAELRRGSGTQFSPRVVEAFVRATEAAVEVVPATESTLLRLLAPQVRSVA
jgi:HD-GYP domain-containing protein (c-di-GMP phosphodiesterase class II)